MPKKEYMKNEDNVKHEDNIRYSKLSFGSGRCDEFHTTSKLQNKTSLKDS